MEWFSDLFVTSNWVTDGLNVVLDYICLWLDEFIYRALGGLYDIFFAFTKLNVVDEFEQFTIIVNRIKLLLGLLMVFKLCFSFLNMLVSPDKFDSADNGAPSILKNTIIVLILLVIVTPGFKLLRGLETAIVEGGFLERLILGQDTNKEITDREGDISLGQSLAYTTYTNFFIGGDGVPCSDQENSNESCAKIREEVAYTILGDGIISRYRDLIDPEKEDAVVYNKVFSTIGGIFLIGMLFSFIIDVGVRAFKLVFYEMIAPIAIMSYIEPKTQKTLWNWLGSTMKTFVDLFLRIIIIYLAIIFISLLPNLTTSNLFEDLDGLTWSIAYFLLVVSIWLFAKMLPKLIGDLFGINMGDSSINPFKRSGLVGAGLGATIGGGIGGILGSALGVAQGKGFRGKVSAGLSGLVGGTMRGVNSGRKSKDLAGVYSNAKTAVGNQNVARKNALENGNFVKRGVNRAGEVFNIAPFKRFGSGMNSKLAANSSAASNLKTAIDELEKKANKRVANTLGYGNAADYGMSKTEFSRTKLAEAMKKGKINTADYVKMAGYNNLAEAQAAGDKIAEHHFQFGGTGYDVNLEQDMVDKVNDNIAMEQHNAEEHYKDLVKNEEKNIAIDELKKDNSEIKQLIKNADAELKSSGESGIMDSLSIDGDVREMKKTLEARARDIENDKRLLKKVNK